MRRGGLCRSTYSKNVEPKVRTGKGQVFDFPAGWAVMARLSRWITSS